MPLAKNIKNQSSFPSTSQPQQHQQQQQQQQPYPNYTVKLLDVTKPTNPDDQLQISFKVIGPAGEEDLIHVTDMTSEELFMLTEEGQEYLQVLQQQQDSRVSQIRRTA